MSSIDDLFKSSVSAKRKLTVSHDPNNYYKSAKVASNGDVKGKLHATVDDEAAENGEDDDDMEAGPSLPPNEDEHDDGGQDDEDGGRFFDTGVSRQELVALDYLDERDGDDNVGDEERYDKAWIRRLIVTFEKRVNKNADLRARFPNEPKKFMASEAELDEEVRRLSILSEHSQYYDDFAKSECLSLLVNLLVHENADIGIAVAGVISELLDDAVDITDEAMTSFLQSILDIGLLELLLANMRRLDEDQQSDVEGITNCLNIILSLAAHPTSAKALATDTDLLKWLLQRVQKKERRTSQNKQTAAESISILVQTSIEARAAIVHLGAVDMLLQQLAPYRHKDPEPDSLEEELVENLFDSLTFMMQDTAGKTHLLDAEGVELALLMIREGKLSQLRALQLLELAVTGIDVEPICEKLVKFDGLKTLFKMIVKPKNPKHIEHVTAILAALLRSLPENSDPRFRIIIKFQEGEYKAVRRLIEGRAQYVHRLKEVEKSISAQKLELDADEQAEMEVEWLAQRLDAGLSVLQTIDVLIAWLMVEDDAADEVIETSLKDNGAKLSDIRKSLKAQRKGIDIESEEANATRDMLEALIMLLKR